MRRISGEMYTMIVGPVPERVKLVGIVALSIIENAGLALRYHKDYAEAAVFETVPAVLFPPVADSVYDIDIGVSQAAPSAVSFLVIRDEGLVVEHVLQPWVSLSVPDAKAKPKAKAKAKVKTKPKAKAKPKVKAKTKSNAKPRPEPGAKVKAKTKSNAKPRPEPGAKVKAKKPRTAKQKAATKRMLAAAAKKREKK